MRLSAIPIHQEEGLLLLFHHNSCMFGGFRLLRNLLRGSAPGCATDVNLASPSIAALCRVLYYHDPIIATEAILVGAPFSGRAQRFEGHFLVTLPPAARTGVLVGELPEVDVQPPWAVATAAAKAVEQSTFERFITIATGLDDYATRAVAE